MLFNSYAFLLGFYPAVFGVFFLLARRSESLAAGWLAAASLFFYGYWSAAALPLLIGSVCVNYFAGLRASPGGAAADRARRRLLIAAVTLNLVVLGYFKYANFFIDNVNLALRAASSDELAALNVVLPIGISFFTFTQIAYLVDCYEGKVRERNFVHYLLFVSYFPHLISGPVLHHSQMMPQFRRRETYRLQPNNVLAGLLFVAIGLAKKALLADEFAQYATPIFNATRDGHEVGLLVAWTGALAYTLQLYFDFSGYTDMALGLSRMLGIHLPVNFNSPYKATSIIEFWRRWHITLSQFLRDYLYFRLGGNRRGVVRRYVNLMTTMVLGGLWHGAGWTFVAWGALHGAYLLMNHAWRRVMPTVRPLVQPLSAVGTFLGAALTFIAVTVAWVFFRSSTYDGAARMLRGMVRFGEPGCSLHCYPGVFGSLTVPPTSQTYTMTFFALGLTLVWCFPTSQSLTQHLTGVRSAAAWFFAGVLLMCIALLAVVNASHHSSEFIYFNF
ncbi:MAG: MBOAT family protein [Gammaproteobacteria bacterium]